MDVPAQAEGELPLPLSFCSVRALEGLDAVSYIAGGIQMPISSVKILS